MPYRRIRRISRSVQSIALIFLFATPCVAADPKPNAAEQKLVDEAFANYREYREKAAAQLKAEIAANKAAIDAMEANDTINVIAKNQELARLKLNLMRSEQLLTRPGQWDAPVLDLLTLKKKGTWGRFHTRKGDEWELHNPQTTTRGVNGAVVSGIMKIRANNTYRTVGPYALVFEQINAAPEGQVHVCVGMVKIKGVSAPRMMPLPVIK